MRDDLRMPAAARNRFLPPDGPPDLTACVDRIGWAELAIRELNELARQYALLDGAKTPEAAAMRLSASIGSSNAVHQLRSALDNLVWQLVLLNKNTPRRINAFYIRDVDTPLVQTKLDEGFRGVHPDHVTELKRCQPYEWASHTASQQHPLSKLEDLWSADKHNVFLMVSPNATTFVMPGVPDTPTEALVYHDGSVAVPTLREALAAVALIVEGFLPAINGDSV
jgi:hypothetical protein